MIRTPKQIYSDAFVYDAGASYTRPDLSKLLLSKIEDVCKILRIGVCNQKKTVLIGLILTKHTSHLNGGGDEEKEEELDDAPPSVEETNESEVEPVNSMTSFKHEILNIRRIVIDKLVYFKGHDTAKMLAYKKTAMAIRKHVDNEDKMCFKEFSRLGGYETQCPIFEQPDTVFINQHGLIDLIFNSKMPLARKFKNLVYDEIIPSILNTGFYVSPSATPDQLQEMQRMLDDERLQKQKFEEKANELQQKLNERPKLDKIELNRLQNHEQILETIYIMTSRRYASEYAFKVGRTNDISKRTSSMNTTNITDDSQMYVCNAYPCYDAGRTELHIHTLLKSFRYVDNREFFIIDYDDLQRIVEICCTDNQTHYDTVNELIEKSRRQTRPDINTNIPKPIGAEKIDQTRTMLETWLIK